MKFAHLADCHIGGWREPELRDLGIKSFEKTIDICIERHVGFILISGDLFNTAIPNIDLIKDVAKILRKAKDANIDVYVIPGSHDFSPSGKTMLDVLEKAGLVINVMKFENGKLKFTEDKTGVKITGILGRKGGLEILDYENLDREHLEKEGGFKIFMFHTALTEFKPEEMEKMVSQSVANLPKNFNYYAGGHVHYIFDKKHENGVLTFPGALFPNNFKELEEFKHGGFYVVDDSLNLEYVPIKLKDVLSIKINADDKTPEDVELELMNIRDYWGKIVTIRIEGKLKSGKPGDINFKKIGDKLKESYCVLKNTFKLTSREFEEIEISVGTTEEIEDNIVKEHTGKISLAGLTKEGEEKLTFELINALNKDKKEGEKVMDFEKRVIEDVIDVLKLGDIWK